MSMPISASAAIASGLTRVGWEPADHTVTPAGASDRAMPSASWLRAEFATQRNSTPRGASARRTAASSSHSGGTPAPSSYVRQQSLPVDADLPFDVRPVHADRRRAEKTQFGRPFGRVDVDTLDGDARAQPLRDRRAPADGRLRVRTAVEHQHLDTDLLVPFHAHLPCRLAEAPAYAV